MTTVTIHAAKTHLSRLIERVEAGEEVVIARRNKPVVKLVPFDQPKPKRQFGSMKGKVWVGSEFFEPLPEEELKLWNGEE
ncbi:MAG TPA: type II toxin-antitoxin system Phd/YefM family antitoxin [Geminicoccaceae bacterium]